MNVLAKRLEQEYPQANSGWTVRSSTFYDWVVPEQLRKSMFALFLGVDFLLLIACANVANLLLARATTRRQEMAMRTALGASPGRLLRQLLIESLIMAGLGGALGLGLTFAAIKLIAAANTQTISRLSETRIDGYVIVFTFVITTVTGLIFGLAPAWWASRVNLRNGLQEGGRSGGNRSTHRMRGALVIAEVTMAAALLVGAGLLARLLARLQAVPLGLEPRNVITMQTSLPVSKYAETQQRVNFYDQLLDRFRAVPGIIEVAAAERAPASGSNWTMEIMLPLPCCCWVWLSSLAIFLPGAQRRSIQP